MRKIKIISLMLISILIFSGCSVNISTEVDKATQQKNITKVQNDVNEIMDKDTSYVRTNLGTPYLTTYYFDLEDYKYGSTESLDMALQNMDAQMIYPKDGYESSALYMEINNNNVIGVQTDSFVGIAPGTEHIPSYASSCDLIIDSYEKANVTYAEKVNLNTLNEYNNKNINKLNTDLDVTTPNAMAHSRDNKKCVNLYLLKDNKNNINNILTVVEENNIIIRSSIETDKTIIKTIQNEFK